MKVLKFGGTSVGSIEVLKTVKKLVENQQTGIAVVVSALGGVTNQLIEISKKASKANTRYTDGLLDIETRHMAVISSLVAAEKQSEIRDCVRVLFSELYNTLKGVFLVQELSAKTSDFILSFGERLSATIIARIIDGAEYIDSREFIKTDRNFSRALVDFEATNALIKDKIHLQPSKPIIVPGFIASTHDGTTTTLGRGGSDYSAAIFAAALDVTVLEIWTDVSGFMTADPNKVVHAYPIEHLSYAEAMELSHFGAKVIYTPTIHPALQKNIPIIIKNTLEPQAPGTIIDDSQNRILKKPIQGISSVDSIVLITIQGAGMVGVTGISMRLFGALARESINIILISQASSECSISFAIVPEDSERAEKAIEKEFYSEIIHLKTIIITKQVDLSIIAIVGRNMIHSPGIAATLYGSLGRNGINVIAIAQGSSELNISTVIKSKDLRKALNVVHDGFFLSEYFELFLFIMGIGNVGGKLLSQISKQQDKLLREHKLRLHICGISDTKKMYLSADGIVSTQYKEFLESQGERADAGTFVDTMRAMNLNNAIFVDCTANNEIAEKYPDILNSYISVVTANKIACSSSYQTYTNLKSISINRGVKFLYETTVGAGLPVIKTISELVKSGDTITRLEAVVSGTLNYIFNVLSPTVSLSQAIKQAKEKGYSEPDPRIDLSGVDVLRKLLILSRESGFCHEKADVSIENFLPSSCFETKSVDQFFQEVESLDASFEQKRAQLQQKGKKWRYIAYCDKYQAKIHLVEIDSTSPFYHLDGNDNSISIFSERYKERPLVIKGAGAGAEVTATGVFADIIRIANI